MRDFFNEDEIALLKETCIQGQLAFSEVLEENASDPQFCAFRLGSIDGFKRSVLCKSFSQLEEIAEDSLEQIALISQKTLFNSDEEKISFFSGVYAQVKFVIDRLFAFRFVKKTLDLGFAYYIPKDHLAYVELWREEELSLQNF